MARRSLLVSALGVFVLLLVACTPVKKAAPEVHVVTLEFTGGPQEWMVPPGVTAAIFDVYGAQGGDNNNPITGPPVGGRGGRTTAILPVTPGELIQVFVGGAGGSNDMALACDKPAGGFNGGAAGGATQQTTNSSGGGGGASDVRRGGTELEDRVLVAAGGGGGDAIPGSTGDGGAGGALVGGAGASGFQVGGGAGGSENAGGAGGAGNPAPDFSGGTGELGVGGAGGGDVTNCPDASFTGGGGGGGGYYGGGGGGGDAANASGAGGGGGSSFGPAATAFESGAREGDGLVVVAYAA